MRQEWQQAGPELVLRFDNERPIKATQFARLLRDLASDYKRLYHDELIVVGVPEGSVMAKLRALSKFAEEANHVFEFGKNLATIFGLSALGVAALNAVTDEHPTPLKAARSLAALAVESGSTLEIKYAAAGKEDLLVRVTPAEAKQAKANTDEVIKAQRPPALPPMFPRSPDMALPSFSPSLPDYNSALRSQLRDLSRGDKRLDDLPPDTRRLIIFLVLELHKVAPFRISQLIEELESEGNVAAAALVRESVSGTADETAQAWAGDFRPLNQDPQD